MAFKIVIERSSDEDLFFFHFPRIYCVKKIPYSTNASSKNKVSRTQYSRCTEMFLKESKMESGEPDSVIMLCLIIK